MIYLWEFTGIFLCCNTHHWPMGSISHDYYLYKRIKPIMRTLSWRPPFLNPKSSSNRYFWQTPCHAEHKDKDGESRKERELWGARARTHLSSSSVWLIVWMYVSARVCLCTDRQTLCDVIWCNLAVGQDVQQGGGPWEKPQDRSSRKRGGELTVPISHLSPPQTTFRASVCPPLLVLAQCLTVSGMHHPLI